MKRRQKPIILITVLVVCGGLVFIMSSASSQGGPDGPRPAPGAAPETNQKVDVPNKSGIAANVKSSLGGPGGKMSAKTMHGMPGAPPAGPSILTQKLPTYTPQPSETSVQTGWYTDQAPSTYAPPKKATKG